MKKKTKIFIYVLAIPLIAIPLIAITLYALIFLTTGGLYFYDVIKANSRMPILLYETDHRALLNACRRLIDQGYKGRYNIRIDRDPEVDSFPKEILQLKPTYVYIRDDNVAMVEMMGGMSHFGVLAFPDGFKRPPQGTGYGDKKLIDGLWYYDDGYRSNPDYDKKIEALRPKQK